MNNNEFRELDFVKLVNSILYIDDEYKNPTFSDPIFAVAKSFMDKSITAEEFQKEGFDFTCYDDDAAGYGYDLNGIELRYMDPFLDEEDLEYTDEDVPTEIYVNKKGTIIFPGAVIGEQLDEEALIKALDGNVNANICGTNFQEETNWLNIQTEYYELMLAYDENHILKSALLMFVSSALLE